MVAIRLRRDTAANWASVNPVLLLGEAGIETDTRKWKVGNGTTPWNSLSYMLGGDGVGGGGVHAGAATLAAGEVTVEADWVTANTVIVVTPQAAGSGVIYIDPADIVEGESFKIKSDDGSDARNVFWIATEGTDVVEPPPEGSTVLYGISNGQGVEADNQVYEIDPSTGDISNAQQITLAGFVVSKSHAMAARPSDGVLFAVIQTSDSTRRLVTIDPVTGVATQVGALTNQISSLAFRDDGTLWAVSGDGGSPPSTLYTVNTSDGTLTSQFALGNGADGETIAFHGNGLMYHSSGNASAVFESVDVDSEVVTSLGTAVFEMYAMGYNPDTNELFGSDNQGNLFTINIANGARTSIAAMFIQNRGLAFATA